MGCTCVVWLSTTNVNFGLFRERLDSSYQSKNVLSRTGPVHRSVITRRVADHVLSSVEIMTFGDMCDQVCASIRNGQVIETLQRRKEASESALCHQTRRSVSCPGSTAAGNSSIASVNRHNTGSQNDCPRQRQRLGLTRAMGEVERHRRLDASRPRSQTHHTTLFGQVKSTHDRTLYQ